VQQPGVIAIPKSGDRQRIRENFGVFDFALSDDEMRRISALAKPNGRMLSPGWSPDWDSAA
jgi:diketogulonate reductase-like aldo/keto reductase